MPLRDVPFKAAFPKSAKVAISTFMTFYMVAFWAFKVPFMFKYVKVQVGFPRGVEEAMRTFQSASLLLLLLLLVRVLGEEFLELDVFNDDFQIVFQVDAFEMSLHANLLHRLKFAFGAMQMMNVRNVKA